MDKSRLTILILFALTLVGMTTFYFMRVWEDSQTRFRTGLPVPKNLVPDSLLTDAERVAGLPPQVPIVRDTDPLLTGSASSSVTLIVFGDFQSELSKQQAADIRDALLAVGGRTSVRTVWRDLPNAADHSKAVAAAIAGRCATKQGKFAGMHDLLFKEARVYDEMELVRFARKLNIDEEAFRTCLRDPAIRFAIDRDIEDAISKAITKIPTLFVEDRALEGYTDAQTLTPILRAALQQATETP
jgi:protein-disulfide isomerase